MATTRKRLSRPDRVKTTRFLSIHRKQELRYRQRYARKTNSSVINGSSLYLKNQLLRANYKKNIECITRKRVLPAARITVRELIIRLSPGQSIYGCKSRFLQTT